MLGAGHLGHFDGLRLFGLIYFTFYFMEILEISQSLIDTLQEPLFWYVVSRGEVMRNRIYIDRFRGYHC